MSGSGTIYTEQSMLGHTLGFAPMAFPAQVFVGLCSAAMPPSETVQGIEAFGNGYQRMQATFALIATPANIAANVATVEYPLASGGWGTLGFFELWDAPTGGNRLYWGALIDTASQLPITITVASGDIVRFSAGTLAVQATTGAGGTSSVGAYLPLGGGTMTGMMWLAGDPTDYLQPATKQYVDAHSGPGAGPGFLPLTGGTVSGLTTFSGTGVALSVTNSATLASAASGQVLIGGTALSGHTHIEFNPTVGANGTMFFNKVGNTGGTDAPQIYSYLRKDDNGSQNYRHLRIQTSVTGNTGIWNIGSESTFSTNSTSSGGHVGIYSQQVRSGVNGGIGCNAWCGVFELRSQTGLPSSQDGILQTLELDIFANGADDHATATGRTILSCVIGQNNTSQAPVEVTNGISFYLFGGHTGWYHNMITAAAQFSIAAFNTKAATQLAGANAIWLGTQHTIALDNAGTAGAANVTLRSDGNNLVFGRLPANAANDAAAATAGVPVGGVYRNASALMVRTV